MKLQTAASIFVQLVFTLTCVAHHSFNTAKGLVCGPVETHGMKVAVFSNILL